MYLYQIKWHASTCNSLVTIVFVLRTFCCSVYYKPGQPASIFTRQYNNEWILLLSSSDLSISSSKGVGFILFFTRLFLKINRIKAKPCRFC